MQHFLENKKCDVYIMNEHCVLTGRPSYCILHCARNFESLLFLFLVSQNFEMQVANDIKSSGSNLFSRTRDINSGTRFRALL